MLNKIDSYIDQCFALQDLLEPADPELEQIQSFEQNNALTAHEWIQKNNRQAETLQTR